MIRQASVAVGLLACIVAGNVQAADKADIVSRIDTARMAVEAFVAKTKNNEAVVADVEAARGYVKKASDALESGMQMFGFGGIKPEAEQEIIHCLAMVDLNIELAESRLAKKRNEEELTSIMVQFNKVKAKVQRFEDRKAELGKLRAEAAKSETLAKELAQVKADKALLVSQIEMLMAERKELEKLKTEKGELSRKLEESATDRKRLAEQAEALVGQRGGVPRTQHVEPSAPVNGQMDMKTIPKPAPAVDTAKLPLLPQNLQPIDGKGEASLSELIPPEKNDAPEPPKLETVIPDARVPQ